MAGRRSAAVKTGDTSTVVRGPHAERTAAMRKRLTDRKVTVTLPGGDLVIEWTAENRILMTGPVEIEHAGEIDATPAAPAGA